MAVFEAEGLCDGFAAGLHVDDFAFAEVVAAAVAAQLGDFVGEGGELAGVDEVVEARFERGLGVVVAQVVVVFAAVAPGAGDAQQLADFFGGAFDGDDLADLGVDLA